MLPVHSMVLNWAGLNNSVLDWMVGNSMVSMMGMILTVCSMGMVLIMCSMVCTVIPMVASMMVAVVPAGTIS